LHGSYPKISEYVRLPNTETKETRKAKSIALPLTRIITFGKITLVFGEKYSTIKKTETT
jgi:hypothetical protein